MDYNYIKQLVERYFECQTTLEEEEILRSFFNQKDIPADLKVYQDLFQYEQEEVKNDVLGQDFDDRIMAMVEEKKPVKAHVITLTQRFMPLFKAAAVVAIVLTLGNAAQVSFEQPANEITRSVGTDFNHAQHGTSVALSDSALIDTLQQSSLQPHETVSPIIK